MNNKTYSIIEIFRSFQGEGLRVGTDNVFVRFSGCNLKCNLEDDGFNCDTNFAGGRHLTIDQLKEEILEVGGNCKNIIFTGGEPTLQLDLELCDALRSNYHLAIETNGTREVADLKLDWITVSPKSAEHTLGITSCHELKYVLGSRHSLPKPSIKSLYYFISPVFEGWDIDIESLKWCKKLVQDNPPWRLSIQSHKLLKMR